MPELRVIHEPTNEETRRPANPVTRVCEAPGCRKAVDPNYLFCAPHRGALPPALLAELRASAWPGSGLTPRWLAAAANAVEYLARCEGEPINNRFRDALDRRPVA